MGRLSWITVWLIAGTTVALAQPQPIIVKPGPSAVVNRESRFPAELLGRYRITDRAAIAGLAILPHESAFLILQKSNTLILLDGKTGAVRAGWNTDQFVGHLAVSADGKNVVIGGHQWITCLSVPELKERWKYQTAVQEFSGAFNCLAFSADGQRLVAAGYRTPLVLLEAKTGRELQTQATVTDSPRMVRFSRDGKFVFTTGAVSRDDIPPPIPHAARWDIAAGTVDPLEKLPQRSVAYSLWEQPDGKLALHGSQNSAIRHLDPQTLQVVSSSPFLSGWSAAISGDGRRYAFAVMQGSVHLYDSAFPQTRLGSFLCETRPDHLALNPDGTELLIGSDDGDVQWWRLRFPRRLDEPASALMAENQFIQTDLSAPTVVGPDDEGIVRYDGHRGAILSMLAYPDSERVLTAGADQRVLLWNLKARKVEARFDGVAGKAFDMYFGAAISQDARQLLLAGGQYRGTQRLGLWNPMTLERRLELGGTKDTTHRVAITPDGKLCAAAGNMHDLVVWDCITGNEKQRIALPQPNQNNLGFHAVELSPDGKTVFCSLGKEVSAYSVETGKLVSVVETGQCQVIRNRPGTAEVVVDTGNGATFLSVPDLSAKRALAYPHHFRYAVFSSDGNRLAIGSSNRLVVWNLETNVRLLERTGKVDHVSLTPDGKTVLFTEASTLAALPLE